MVKASIPAPPPILLELVTELVTDAQRAQHNIGVRDVWMSWPAAGDLVRKALLVAAGAQAWHNAALHEPDIDVNPYTPAPLVGSSLAEAFAAPRT